MEGKKYIILLLCILLIFSNMATYHFTSNYFFNAAENSGGYVGPGEESKDSVGGVPEDLTLFMKVFYRLQERYIERVPVDQLVQGAIEGMIDALGDPQTVFLNKDELENLFIQTSGSFSGIGIEVSMVDDLVTIIAPIKGSPGDKIGLAPGDQIISVDGKNIEGISLIEAVNKLRGPEGTQVNIEIKREGLKDLLEFEVTRKNIVLETVNHEKLEDEFGYIQITNFDERTGLDFRESLEQLENQNIKGLVIDLRDNPGGLLQGAVEVGEAIVPAGPITFMVDGQGEVEKTYSSYADPRPYPITVLVNSNSASASEIIAGALQDSGAGVLVGEPTFGKATVQHIEEFFDEEFGLRYTVAKYLTPSKNDISEEGLQPDIEQDLPEIFQYHRYYLSDNLYPGDYGDDVLYLQKFLQFLGYSEETEGIFDEKTKANLKDFQGKRGLKPDGKFEENTARELRERVGELLPEHDTQLQEAIKYLEKHNQQN